MYLLDRYLLISSYALCYLGKQIASRTYASTHNYLMQLVLNYSMQTINADETLVKLALN